MNIGVFDSGLGGLIVFKEIISYLPQYSYIYLGDNARVPYGSRSPERIYQFTLQAVEFLFKKNCQLIVLACNTASAIALEKIQRDYLPKKYPDRQVLGLILPTIEFLDLNPSDDYIGIIGTRATINSKIYQKKIKEINPRAKIIAKATPLLVPFIEEGEINSRAFRALLEDYLKDFSKKKISKLILACTHYGSVEKQIEVVLGSKVEVISQGKIVAQKLSQYLENHPEIEKKLTKTSSSKIYLTDKPASHYFSLFFKTFKKADLDHEKKNKKH
ncbi:MAG: glutamate racemase [Patescibacteria group bacterium]|nr:glutamate racemase [Patescibacteria group bacterium]